MEPSKMPELIESDPSPSNHRSMANNFEESNSLPRKPDAQWGDSTASKQPSDEPPYYREPHRGRYQDTSRSIRHAHHSEMDIMGNGTHPLSRGTSSRKHSNNYHNNHTHRGYMEQQRHQKIRLKREPTRNCVSYLTGILHCYNVFLLVLGSGVLAVGVWLLVKDYNSREISAIVGSRLFEYLTYGLTAGGGAVAILAFCGCCGTMRQDKFVLGFYGSVLTIVILMLFTGFALGIMFRSELQEDLTEHFKTSIIKHYGVDVERNSFNRLVTDAWDAMQRTFQCCGAVGDEDSLFSWAIFKLHSDWYAVEMRDKQNRPYVPESCCVTGMSKLDCQGLGKIRRGFPVKGPGQSYVSEANDALLKKGCYDRALDYIENNSMYITIVAGAVPLLLIVGMIISFYLCCKVKNEDDDFEDGDEVEV
ncbi:tetraspanin-18B-like isoform X1 [Argopecten irradians]|uniref:tetraspanin-18B-like isoform X1 n=1 Tax=Argopecten irradians TaxID=31199 RepID=UPI0037100415